MKNEFHFFDGKRKNTFSVSINGKREFSFSSKYGRRETPFSEMNGKRLLKGGISSLPSKGRFTRFPKMENVSLMTMEAER